MKKIWYYLPSIIFNLVETLVIFLIGKLLNLPTMHILIIFLNFAIFRMLFKYALHYKDWYRCLIWSTLVFISFFTLAKVNIIIAILMSIFSSYILTKRGDIKIVEDL